MAPGVKRPASAARNGDPVSASAHGVASATSGLRCARMNARTRAGAATLIAGFLGADAHYRASAATYGDGGRPARERALDLFLAHPEIGFVWLVQSPDDAIVGACVVCYAISTARGARVAKLDDVTIDAQWRGRGVGSALLRTLAAKLQRDGVKRIDTACHRDNTGAWRFYERLGFRPLHEERLALLL
jgi:ribosomal protein S18 acetylase RimI-like enzyme